MNKKRFGICFLVALALILLLPGGRNETGPGNAIEEFLLLVGRLIGVLLVSVALYAATLLIDRIRGLRS